MESKRELDLSELGTKKKSEKIDIVHTYLWGPTHVSSLGGSLYYVTFIDDATRKIWVYYI